MSVCRDALRIFRDWFPYSLNKGRKLPSEAGTESSSVSVSGIINNKVQYSLELNKGEN